MFRLLSTGLGLLVGCIAFCWGVPLHATPSQPPAPKSVTSSKTTSPSPSRVESGEVKAPSTDSKKKEDCETGCGSHGHIPKPTQAQTLLWLRSFATEPLKAGSRSLESLLFHHASTRQVLNQVKVKLPPKHSLFLRQQLQRSEAWISVRIRTHGSPTYVEVKPHKTALSEHFHLHAEKAIKIQAPSFGGRIERVGLNRLWVRI